MGVKYWVAKSGGWSGPTGLGTEASPYLGAIAVRNALGTGIVAGDTVIFMGEYGPVLLAEIVADFGIGSNYTISTAITRTSNFPAPGNVACRGGVLFGTQSGSGSNCVGVTFEFRGPYPWHIDARGATTNAERMMAALCVQGSGNTVRGLRVAAPNWNYIAAGRIAGVGTFADEASWENFGLLMWGAVGSTTEDCVGWGSNGWGRSAIHIAYSTTSSQAIGATTTRVRRNEGYGAMNGVYIEANSTLLAGDGSQRAHYAPAAGSVISATDNKGHDCRWGDNLATPAVNNALYHGNGMLLTNFIGSGSLIESRWNEIYGTCQDGHECIGSNIMVADLYVHDLNPGKTQADTFDRWVNSAGTWTLASNPIIGDAIKLGLLGYAGNVSDEVWLAALGTPAGSQNIDSARNLCLRNRVVNTTGYGITCNGSHGMVIAANEILNSDVGVNVRDYGATNAEGQNFLLNNYLNGRTSGLQMFGYGRVYAYNNIFDGPNAAGGAIKMVGAAAAKLYGSKNLARHGQITVSGSNQNLLTDTITSSTMDYVAGVGPTVGGNCDGAGNWLGIVGARVPAAWRDINNRKWRATRVPLGPRGL
ncbi:MAG: hypothetical protein RJA36_1602 [Pseudomonadota bacterium]|jgi:hypothetical protein